MVEIGIKQKLYCNTCKHKTNHELKNTHVRREWEVEDEGTPHEQPLYKEEWEYRFWVCSGCDTASLEEAYCGPGMTDHNGDKFYDCTTYPKRSIAEWPPKHFKSIEANLNNIYREIIITYNSGLSLSCAIGLRALLEGVCVNKGITDKVSRGLEGKLDKLKRDEHLPENIVEGLHSFKFMGDNAAHRLEAPEIHELRLAIEIMEDLLNFLYELNYRLEKSTQALAQKHVDDFEALNKRKQKKSIKTNNC